MLPLKSSTQTRGYCQLPPRPVWLSLLLLSLLAVLFLLRFVPLFLLM